MGSIPATLDISSVRNYKYFNKPKKNQKKQSFLIKKSNSQDIVKRRSTKKGWKSNIPFAFSTVSRSYRHIPINRYLYNLKKKLRIRLNRSYKSINTRADLLTQIPFDYLSPIKTSIFFIFQRITTNPHLIRTQNETNLIPCLFLWKIVYPISNLNFKTGLMFLNPSCQPQISNFDETLWRYTTLIPLSSAPNPLNPLLTLNLVNSKTLELASFTRSRKIIPTKINQIEFSSPFFYINPTQTNLIRAISSEFCLLQRYLWNFFFRQKFFNDQLIEFNVLMKRRLKRKNIIQLLIHKVAPRLINDITHQEQLPSFTEISPLRRVDTLNTPKSFLWTRFFSSHRSRSLRRKLTGLSPNLESILNVTGNLRSLDLRNNVHTTRSLKTLLLARPLRQFIRRRLFRGMPPKTFLRSLRRSRTLVTRFRRSNIRFELKKKNKRIQALRYEKALFEEILSSPKGTQGPLLSSLLYTGFEQMPLLNQKFGNQLFIKCRNLRPLILKKKIPKKNMRRYEIRNFLLQYAPWAKRIEKFRRLSRALRLSTFLPHYVHLSPDHLRRKSKKTRRYWRKRAAFFARRSSVVRSFRRRIFRFKRWKTKGLRLSLSRNFRIKTQTLSAEKLQRLKVKFLRSRPNSRKRLKTCREEQEETRAHLFLQASSATNLNQTLIPAISTLQNRQHYYNRQLRRSLILLLRFKSSSKAQRHSSHFQHSHPIFKDTYLHPLFLQDHTYKHSLPRANPSSSYLTLPSLLPLPYLMKFWTNPFVIKYFFLSSLERSVGDVYTLDNLNNAAAIKNFITTLQHQLEIYSFNAIANRLPHSNIWAFFSSHYVLQKKLLRSVSQMVFKANVATWAQRCLLNFLENISGRKIAISIGPFVEHILTLEDYARCFLWDNRSSGFKKLLGHRIFTSEAVMLVTAALRLRDPTLLANWIRGMLYRMSFWKYRILFRYLKFLIQHLFRFNFSEFNFKGFKLRLKGKISVGGNSRSRVLFYRVGDTSHSKMSNKIAYDLSYINTFTGILGFKLWFFY